MDKELKKHYHFMDLKYDATVEEIKSRQKVMIKVYRAKGIKTGKSYKNEIARVNFATSKILSNIKQNGIPKGNLFNFSSSINDMATLIFVLIIMMIICIVSFLTLL